MSFGIAISRMHERHEYPVLSATKRVWVHVPSRAGRANAPHTVTSRWRESQLVDTKSRLDRKAWPRMPTEARSAGCSAVAARRISVTALRLDLTDEPFMARLASVFK